jgi:hypothetical protein
VEALTGEPADFVGCLRIEAAGTGLDDVCPAVDTPLSPVTGVLEDPEVFLLLERDD